MRRCLSLLLLAAAAQAANWSLKQKAVVTGFEVPECVLVDPSTGAAYVSNIQAAEGGYWSDDGQAFLSRLKPGGALDLLKWRPSTPATPLNAPKGMCLVGRILYVADNTVVRRFDLKTGVTLPVLTDTHWKKLNDMAGDGQVPYVSDTETGQIWKLATQGHQVVTTVPGANGLTFAGAKMYAVSWGAHEVYEVNPAGGAKPIAFSLAKHFKALDGIEVLDDGTFLVSDNLGNAVFTISPDRKTVRKVLTSTAPADIGIDRTRKLVYVPEFSQRRVLVCSLLG